MSFSKPGRRRGFAVPGQIERDDAEGLGHFRVVEDAAILAAVGPGRVQAQQRYAVRRSRFLEIDAMRAAVEVDMQIAARHGFDTGLTNGGGRRRLAGGAAHARENVFDQRHVPAEFEHGAADVEMPDAHHAVEALVADGRNGLRERGPRLGRCLEGEIGLGRCARFDRDGIAAELHGPGLRAGMHARSTRCAKRLRRASAGLPSRARVRFCSMWAS